MMTDTNVKQANLNSAGQDKLPTQSEVNHLLHQIVMQSRVYGDYKLILALDYLSCWIEGFGSDDELKEAFGHLAKFLQEKFSVEDRDKVYFLLKSYLTESKKNQKKSS